MFVGPAETVGLCIT